MIPVLGSFSLSTVPSTIFGFVSPSSENNPKKSLPCWPKRCWQVPTRLVTTLLARSHSSTKVFLWLAHAVVDSTASSSYRSMKSSSECPAANWSDLRLDADVPPPPPPPPPPHRPCPHRILHHCSTTCCTRSPCSPWLILSVMVVVVDKSPQYRLTPFVIVS